MKPMKKIASTAILVRAGILRPRTIQKGIARTNKSVMIVATAVET